METGLPEASGSGTDKPWDSLWVGGGGKGEIFRTKSQFGVRAPTYGHVNKVVDSGEGAGGGWRRAGLLRQVAGLRTQRWWKPCFVKGVGRTRRLDWFSRATITQFHRLEG